MYVYKREREVGEENENSIACALEQSGISCICGGFEKSQFVHNIVLYYVDFTA